MNIENVVNSWLAEVSQNQWQLDDGECHLTNNQGEHYSTMQLNQVQLLIMFPLHPSAISQNATLYSDLLLLNNHPDIIGFASFSLAVDGRTGVLSTALPIEVINSNTLTDFWLRSLEARNNLFIAVTENEDL